jgi:copper chaperone
MNITVPTIACEGCIDTIIKAIHKLDATAVVNGDVASKRLSIQTQANDAEIKAAITKAGHEYA